MTSKFHKTLDVILKILCASLLALMVVLGTYQIVSRYFFNKPSTISEELLTYSFAWLALFAAAYVFGARDHMRMNFILSKLPDKIRHIIEIITEIIILIFAATVMIYGGISIMNLTMSQSTASLGIPMGIVYMAVPISGILIVIYGILNIISLLSKEENL
ncbi:MAG: TRAP transporter small permease [Clostridia bacterium]|nr:TRAP transporter small permease [Clostridia bacterium]